MKVRTKVLIGSVLVVLLGVGGWIGWRWYTTPTPPDIPLDGLEKPVAEAVEKAVQEVRREPRSAASWGKLSLVLMANGLPQHAIPCFAQAERLDPNDPRWPCLRGVLLRDSDPEEGTRLLRRALELAAPGQYRADITFALARALIDQCEFGEAAECVQVLRQLEPGSPRVHFGFALVALARKDMVEAREHLRALTNHPMTRKKACSLLATLTDTDKKQARAYQEQAEGLPPDTAWPDPYDDRIQSYRIDRMKRIELFYQLQDEGKHFEAVSFLRDFVAESPDAETCYILGLTFHEMREAEEATRVLQLAIDLNPHSVKAHALLGEALLRRGERRLMDSDGKAAAEDLFRQAVAAEARALAIESNHGYAHLIRGLALNRLGRTDDALRALREAVACQPELADRHQGLGEALCEARQFEEGLKRLEDAVRLAPPGDNRPRSALEKWQKASKLRPDAPTPPRKDAKD